jgi:hypothetical protein
MEWRLPVLSKTNIISIKSSTQLGQRLPTPPLSHYLNMSPALPIPSPMPSLLCCPSLQLGQRLPTLPQTNRLVEVQVASLPTSHSYSHYLSVTLQDHQNCSLLFALFQPLTRVKTSYLVNNHIARSKYSSGLSLLPYASLKLGQKLSSRLQESQYTWTRRPERKQKPRNKALI